MFLIQGAFVRLEKVVWNIVFDSIFFWYLILIQYIFKEYFVYGKNLKNDTIKMISLFPCQQ